MLTGRLPYTLTDGTMGVLDLPAERLNPGELADVDVEQAIRSRFHKTDIATAGLEFEYTGAPGAVVMSAESVSTSGNQVFRVPMWDVPAQRNGTGGYPWFIDGGSSTLVYIKNVTDEKQKYTLFLTFDGGVYAPGLKAVEPHQTVVLDLRALRDHQVPDERGRKIPLAASRGKIEWSVRGPNSIALLGRSEQADIQKGISSSYACWMCCPNSFYDSGMDPSEVDLFNIGDVAIFRPWERDHDCYGGVGPEFYMGGTFNSDNSYVVSVDQQGNATAQDYGVANISCQWDVYDYVLTTQDIQPFCETHTNTTTPAGRANIVSVLLSLRSNGSVSSDNSALSMYSSTYATTNLGVFFSTGTGNSLWRVGGVEIVGTLIPSSYPRLVIIHRLVIELRSYTDYNATPYETITNQDDTSTSDFRDDDPQSGGSNGKVYDLDAPGIGPGTDAPVGSIVRRRVNFVQYTTVGTIQLPNSLLYWFTRESVIKTANGDQLLNDISGDNTVGVGATPLTWNLQ